MQDQKDKAATILRTRNRIRDAREAKKEEAKKVYDKACADADAIADAAIATLTPAALDLLADAYELNEDPPAPIRKRRTRAAVTHVLANDPNAK